MWLRVGATGGLGTGPPEAPTNPKLPYYQLIQTAADASTAGAETILRFLFDHAKAGSVTLSLPVSSRPAKRRL